MDIGKRIKIHEDVPAEVPHKYDPPAPAAVPVKPVTPPLPVSPPVPEPATLPGVGMVVRC